MLRTFVLSLCLTGSVAAQDEAAAPGPARGEPFVVETRNDGILEFVGQAGDEDEPQEHERAAAFRVAFAQGGAVEISECELADGITLRAHGDPGHALDWLRLPSSAGEHEEGIGNIGLGGIGLGAARGAFTMVLLQSGASARDVGRFFHDLLEFPEQVASLTIEVRQVGEERTDWSIALQPRPGSWLARLHGAARPLGAVPDFGWGDTQVRVGMQPEGWQVLLEPWHAFHRSWLRKLDRDGVDGMLASWTAALDGRFALAHDSETMRSIQLMGADPARHAVAVAHPTLAEVRELMSLGESFAEVPGLPDRPVRGVDVSRVGALPQVHGVPEFVARTRPYLGAYAGLVGDTVVAAAIDRDRDEGGVEALRALLSGLRDGAVTASPMPPSVLASGRWAVGAWLERMDAEGAMLPQLQNLVGDLPAELEFDVRRSQSGFALDLRIR